MDRKSLSKHNLAVNKHKAYGVFRAALPVFPQLFATTHHSFVTSTRLLKNKIFFTSNYTVVAWLQTPQLLIVWLLCYKELVWPDEFKLTVIDQQFEFEKNNFFFVAILLPQLNRLGTDCCYTCNGYVLFYCTVQTVPCLFQHYRRTLWIRDE